MRTWKFGEARNPEETFARSHPNRFARFANIPGKFRSHSFKHSAESHRCRGGRFDGVHWGNYVRQLNAEIAPDSRLRGSAAARHARFAVATHRRLGSACAEAVPRRSVDGEGARPARQSPGTGPYAGAGRQPRRKGARVASEARSRTWPSRRPTGRKGHARRVRRRVVSTATPRASPRAVRAKTCASWYQARATSFGKSWQNCWRGPHRLGERAARVTDARRRRRGPKRVPRRCPLPAKREMAPRRPTPDTAPLRPSTRFAPLRARPGGSAPDRPHHAHRTRKRRRPDAPVAIYTRAI